MPRLEKADSCGEQRIFVSIIEQLRFQCQHFVLRCAKKGAPSSCALFFGEEYRCSSRPRWHHRAHALAELFLPFLCQSRSSESSQEGLASPAKSTHRNSYLDTTPIAHQPVDHSCRILAASDNPPDRDREREAVSAMELALQMKSAIKSYLPLQICNWTARLIADICRV